MAPSWQTEGMPNRSLRHRTWFPTSAPQTLQFSVVLLYWNAAIALLIGLLVRSVPDLIGMALITGDIAGGYGVANERKWGYQLAVVTAVLTLVLMFVGFGGISIISILFGVLLVVLLLHPISRNYYRLWFR